MILAFLEFGLGSAGLTTLVYLGVNIGLGQIIEPRLQGQGLGLSPWLFSYPRFLGLVTWDRRYPTGYPFGYDSKISFEESPKYRWLAVLRPERPANSR